jgi:hypothetical protein
MCINRKSSCIIALPKCDGRYGVSKYVVVFQCSDLLIIGCSEQPLLAFVSLESSSLSEDLKLCRC